MDVLRVRQLTIVDQKGIDRVILGAPLPDLMVNGAASAPRSDFRNRRAGREGQRARRLRDGRWLRRGFQAIQILLAIGVLGGKPALVVQQNGETIPEQPRRVKIVA
jgi:hypothetical protein